MADKDQIIIIKKVSGHGGHHGGAWKVAYADFVTALMALFIVLWLMNSSKPVQEAVGGYFRDPNGTASKKGTALGGSGSASAPVKEDLTKLKDDLIKAMEKLANFDKLKKQVELTVTPEGLRIEMMEDAQGTFFENGKAQPTPSLQSLLKVLSVEAGKLPNPISIEGHTDSNPFSDSKTYGNWELSSDRANAARRLMEDSGLRPNQVVQVRGYADRNLRNTLHPEDASNRRISVLIQYLPKRDQPTVTTKGTVPSITQPAVPDKVVAAGTKSEAKGSEAKAEKPGAEKPAAGK